MRTFRFTHIDHCTVLITNVEQARQFYGQVMGLTEIPPPREFDFVAVWYDLGGSYLHLLLKNQPDPPSPRHFCLHVTDVAAARTHLLACGVRVEDTLKIDAADRFFVRDPDGNRIEILKWTRPYEPNTDGQYPD